LSASGTSFAWCIIISAAWCVVISFFGGKQNSLGLPSVANFALNVRSPSITPVSRGEREGLFRAALTVARQQKAKSWELHAAMSMARLWRDQGSRGKLAILSPRSTGVHRRFDTLDLKEAKALLDALAS
jgi:hypothetical protein